MIHRHHNYLFRVVMGSVILMGFVYIALLLDPTIPFTLNKLTLTTNKAVYYPGDEIHVKIDYCSKKEQEIFATFYLIDSIPVEGEFEPILLRGPEYDWEEEYRDVCEIIWPTAFVIRDVDYESPYIIRGIFTYRVNMVKWDDIVLESNEFTIENDYENLFDQFDYDKGPS